MLAPSAVTASAIARASSTSRRDRATTNPAPRRFRGGGGDTIYVANTSSGKLSSVTVYAPGAYGDAKPIAIVRGSASQLKVFAGAIAVR